MTMTIDFFTALQPLTATKKEYAQGVYHYISYKQKAAMLTQSELRNAILKHAARLDLPATVSETIARRIEHEIGVKIDLT
jgi:hypothetical protein